MSSKVLRTLYEKGYSADVFLGVNKDERKLKAHRFVLMSAGQYFKTLLSAKSESHTLIINNGMSFETLEALIRFIYTKEFKTKLSADEIIDLLRGAQYLEVNIEEGLRYPIEKVLHSSNACRFLPFVDGDIVIWKNVFTFIIKNLGDIRGEATFLELDVDAVQSIVEQLKSSVFAFETIISWIKHNYKERYNNFSELLKSGVRFDIKDPEEDIPLNYLMEKILPWCICMETKRFVIHYLGLLAINGPVLFRE